MTCNNKGFTLIELIITIALVGIIAISFLGMFTTGFSGIISAGDHSRAGYSGQSAIESIINDVSVSGEPNISTSTLNDASLSIQFDTIEVNVTGNIEIVDYEDGNIKSKVATFLPD